jgi:lysophospholipid acyltransferase (LPLAT)-like uncharacterized protein
MHIHLPIGLSAPIVLAADRALKATVRWAIEDPFDVLEQSQKNYIFACRHGQLIPLLWAMEGRGLSIMVSRSRDGELLTRVLRVRGFELVRGSSRHAGFGAGRAALATLREGRSLGLAVDGPRGPWGLVQPGILRLAQKTGVAIVPLLGSGDARWVARGSWDRFEVPRPGANLRIAVGEPIQVDVGQAGLLNGAEALASALGGSTLASAPKANSDALPATSYGHS